MMEASHTQGKRPETTLGTPGPLFTSPPCPPPPKRSKPEAQGPEGPTEAQAMWTIVPLDLAKVETCGFCGWENNPEDMAPCDKMWGAWAHTGCAHQWAKQSMMRTPARCAVQTAPEGTKPRILLACSGDMVAPHALPYVLQERGFEVDPIDTMLGGPEHDLLDDQVFLRLIDNIAAKRYVGGGLAPPCAPRSRAHNRPGGPPPLATRESPYGMPGQDENASDRIAESNMIISRIIQIALALTAAGAWWWIEYPADLGDSPSLWILEMMILASEATGALKALLHQGPWGAWTPKPTEVRGTLPGLEALETREYSEERWDRQLEKADTAGAAAYPPGMTRRMADIMVAATVAAAGLPAPAGQTNTKVKPWVSHCKMEVVNYLDQDPEEQAVRQVLGTMAPPLVVKSGPRFRPFADGAGRCSLGRWAPSQRPPRRLAFLAEPAMKVIAELDLVGELQGAFKRGFRPKPQTETETAAGKAAPPKVQIIKPKGAPPWNIEEVAAKVLDGWDAALGRLGHPPLRRQIPTGQPHRCRAIADLLGLAGDPEAQWVDTCQDEGVSMGINRDVPHVPLVFREKVRWRLPEWEGPFMSAETNYASAEAAADVVKKKFQDMRDKGMVLEVDYGAWGGDREEGLAEVARLCSCEPHEVIVEKLGDIPEKGKSRTILDCTVTGVNGDSRIPNLVECPGVPEQEMIMVDSMVEKEGERATKRAMLKWDVESAHNRIKKLKRHWRFLVAHIMETFFVYMVGAFGESSAAFWWTRLYG